MVVAIVPQLHLQLFPKLMTLCDVMRVTSIRFRLFIPINTPQFEMVIVIENCMTLFDAVVLTTPYKCWSSSTFDRSKASFSELKNDDFREMSFLLLHDLLHG